MVYTFTFFSKAVLYVFYSNHGMLSIIHDMIKNVGLCEVLKRQKLGEVLFMVQ